MADLNLDLRNRVAARLGINPDEMDKAVAALVQERMRAFMDCRKPEHVAMVAALCVMDGLTLAYEALEDKGPFHVSAG